MQRTIVALVCALFSACISVVAADAQTVLRIGYSGGGVAKNLHLVIEKAGLWKKRGLEARLIYFTSGATMAQATMSGDIDIGDSDVPAMLNAVSSGILDGKLISVYVNRFPFSFITRKEIKKPEDLKGRKLAISRFGSSSDVTTRMLLKFWKLDPDKDVNILQVAGPTRLPALFSGQIDGTLIGTYDVPKVLESGCCTALVDLLELPLEYARFGQVVPTSLLKTQHQTVLRFVEGLIEGIHVFKTNRELALSVLKQSGIASPQYGYQRVAAALRENPLPEPVGVQAVLDSVKTTKSKITLAKDVMDTSLVEEIDKTGFIGRLYGK
ncbi:MAG TPA: ABC transporter substrate-binding protein [Candidatus Binatia bacterium]|jgi:ABC-type nitrate/sulfonate/bicarbonate transport system substrate-binding protein